ncbi:MAG: 7-carboxy-7-deazaguanine synthase QueE [Eubacteriales bacterium]
MTAHLVEMFSSIQGEGPYVGVRQIFLRFSGCNLKCAYCDTAYEFTPSFRVEGRPGSGVFVYLANPVEPAEVAKIATQYNLDKNHSLSLTGGEPLLQAEFIKQLGLRFKKRGPKFYLETNGTLVSGLLEVIHLIDIISMDIKLPSTTKSGELWDTHRDFLKAGAQKEIFVKAVVTDETTESEIIKTCEIIKEVNSQIPLILQPVHSHPFFPGRDIPVDKLIIFQELAMDYIKDVRVIPQTHKFLGQL